MTVGEIAGGLIFGSIALVADGLHMSTHAGALLLAALAYTYARRHAHDPRFTFGPGKFGDLAGFTSAIVLAMIALLIGYEAATRLFHPVKIHFAEAIPIAALGLLVNVGSAWLLGAGEHRHQGRDHGHRHGHPRGHPHGDAGAEVRDVQTGWGTGRLAIFEDGVPPRFRFRPPPEAGFGPGDMAVETIRAGGAAQRFAFDSRGDEFESVDEIPEPHEFTARLILPGETHPLLFEEHAHHAHDRDNNMRSALVHVLADAMVSVLVIVGLLLARWLGWMWMDPVAGLVGAVVIASWSYGLIRDTGVILLDVNPDPQLTAEIRRTVEAEGDSVCDLHLWRLGPGHLGAIVSIAGRSGRGVDHYREALARFPRLSHVTIEIAASLATAHA